jgi:hypothetical protein
MRSSQDAQGRAWLVGAGLSTLNPERAFSNPVGGDVAIWAPEVERDGPALVLSEAAGWRPMTAYLPSLCRRARPGEWAGAARVSVSMVRVKGRRGGGGLALVAHSEVGEGSYAVSLLRAVDSLAGWNLPPDLAATYPVPEAEEPGVQLAAVDGSGPVAGQPVRARGGLVSVRHGDGAGEDAATHSFILWGDRQPRGWSELLSFRPYDARHTVAVGASIFGPDLWSLWHGGRWVGTPVAAGALWMEGEQVALNAYPSIEVKVGWSLGLLQAHLVHGPIRAL